MAEDAVITADVPDDDPTPTPSGTKSHAATLHEDVARVLKEEHSGTVRQRVINTLVEDELERRKKLVLDGLGKLKTQRQEIIKLERGGTQQFGLDGKPASTMTYTKQQLEEIKKAKEKADKLERSLDKAIVNSDYSKLQELAK